MLKQRITVGVAGGLFIIISLCMDVRILAVVFSMIAIIGLSEIYNATNILTKQKKLCVFSYAYTLITFLIVSFSQNAGIALATMLFIYGFILFAYLIFCNNECDFVSLAEIFLQTVYVSFLFAHVVLIRKLSYGNYILWFVFITAWLSDTLAFFVGRKFGKNKLLPAVSPKKTVEGAVGGLAGSVIFNLIYAAICSIGFNLSVNYFAVFFMAVIAGVMSQIGDLAASVIKREYNLKDYSSLLPGHGGILDRFDSVLYVAPTVYYFAVIFSLIA